MSRIGKQFITVPQGVTVDITDNCVKAQGPKGILTYTAHPDMACEAREGGIAVTLRRSTKQSSALWGLTRALVANMVIGVTKGFEKKLQFQGIGFRANVDAGVLVMQLGFTHPIRVAAPDGIVFKVEKDVITVSGIDCGLVGRIAAHIRALKPPEPYKGKGVRYQHELIRRKSGKKAVATGG